MCLKETKKGIETYRNLWNSLGISVDWSKTYSTISPLPTKVSQWSLIDLYKRFTIQTRINPMVSNCQTAISQSDMEDKRKDSKMNYTSFLISGESVLIATTRPELLALVAFYFNPEDERYKNLIGQKVTVPLFN